VPYLNAINNVIFADDARAGTLSVQSYKPQEQLMDLVGLAERKSIICQELSGGEQQRVAIAGGADQQPNAPAVRRTHR